MKNASRRLRKLRRRVYRDLPAATAGRIAEVDPATSYADLAQAFARDNLGVGATGAAMALWRAVSERGYRAWCYEYGFADVLTLAVTIVEADGALQIHDAFFNRTYPVGFFELLDRLRHDWPVAAAAETRDRKLYLVDPAVDDAATLRWLAVNAERELAPTEGLRRFQLRRFQLRWDEAAFGAISPAPDAARRVLEACGHPPLLDFMMLHPVAVFDGTVRHRDIATMPLIAGRDLHSPAAASRLSAARVADELAAAQAEIARLAGAAQDAYRDAARLRTSLDDALRQRAADRDLLSQRQAGLAAELAAARSQLSAAQDETAARDSRIAQLQAALADTESERLELLADGTRLNAALDDARAQVLRLHDRAAAEQSRAGRQLALLLAQDAAVPAEIGRRDQFFDEFATLAGDEFGIEALLAVTATEIAETARRRLRQFEREHAQAERAVVVPGREDAAVGPPRRRGALRGLLRGLFGRGGRRPAALSSDADKRLE